MNRENKKRKYDKKYFRTHPCTDSFICKVCDGRLYRQELEVATGTIAPTACTVSIWIMSQVTAVRTAAGGWSPSASGYGKTASGQSSTDAVPAERSYQTALPPTIIQ